MEYLIAWCGFLGAWLLVAGPLYQAALELRAEDIEIERIKSVKDSITLPPAISVWWWLLPPFKISLERKRSRLYRRIYIKALTTEDASALVSFISKATAWMFVATGGLLIAIKETYELIHILEIPIALFWIAIIIMPAFCIGNIIIRTARSKKLLDGDL